MGRAHTTDLYSVLGVQQTADTATIRKAYLAAALQKHPDKADTAEGFDAVSQAWQVSHLTAALMRIHMSSRERASDLAAGPEGS